MIRIFSILTLITLSSLVSFSQELTSCDTNTIYGQNLLFNGDFEKGDTGFNIPGFRSWNKTSPVPEYSEEGDYFVAANIARFNDAFKGEAYQGNRFLMIDGACEANSIVWESTVSVTANTRYFFEVFITSIYDKSTANLKFEIDGELLPENLIAPATPGEWVSFVDSSWFSNSTEGEITIRIRNDQTTNCEDGNDFALDNISFTAGCFFGAEGEIPELGENLSICGTNGSVTITPDVPVGNVYDYYWSTNDTTSAIEITEAGTYAVCMTTNGSCIKSDIISISESFEIEVGGNNAVCKEISDVLTVDHTGDLVSYKWFKDNEEIDGATTNTYTPTEVGTYKIEVTDDAGNCGTETDDMTLSVGSFSVSLGSDQSLCSPANANLTANYDGTSYQWYLNDVRLGEFNTKTVTVNQVGAYKVIVSDAICEDQEATVTISSETFTAVNANFCPSEATSVTLAIEGTTSDEANYKWYSDETLTTEVGSGLSHETAASLQESTTYFVKDIAVFQDNVGPTADVLSTGGYGNQEDLNKTMSFDVTNNIVIDSVLVFPMHLSVNTSANIGFSVYDRATDQLVESSLTTITLPDNPGEDYTKHPTYIPVNISLPPGEYYARNTGTTVNLYYNQGQWVSSFPYTDANNILSITGFSEDSWSDGYSFFYDWHFSSGVLCDPVEVKAVYDPIFCDDCTAPEAIIEAETISITEFEEIELDGTGSTVDSDITYLWEASDTALYISMDDQEELITNVTITDATTDFYLTVTRTTETGKTCDDKDTVNVKIGVDENFTLDVSNAFSPNGDGTNDVFEIDDINLVTNFKLQIFNKWGSLIFEQTKATDFWDGTRNGKPLPVATYYYTLEYKVGNTTKTTEGYISLIR